MPKYPCPICGDPNGYPIWVTPDDPPEGCPQDPTGSVRNVTECKYQMGKARQRAEFRKLVPDAFDGNGNILPGQLARVLTEFAKHHPGEALVM